MPEQNTAVDRSIEREGPTRVALVERVTRTGRRIFGIGRAVVDHTVEAAFWSAIVLPVAYLPLLVGGLDSALEVRVFLCVLAGHVVALALGRFHRPE